MNCDKCNTPVDPRNDATIIEAILSGCALIGFASQPRHFLPVKDKAGHIVCEGSPSRAQYIEGQPKDERGFGYHKEYEKLWRDAYQKTQS